MFKICQEGGRNSGRYRYASLQSCCIYQLGEELFLRCQIWEKLLCVHRREEGSSDCAFVLFWFKNLVALLKVCRTAVKCSNLYVDLNLQAGLVYIYMPSALVTIYVYWFDMYLGKDIFLNIPSVFTVVMWMHLYGWNKILSQVKKIQYKKRLVSFTAQCCTLICNTGHYPLKCRRKVIQRIIRNWNIVLRDLEDRYYLL